MHLFLGFHIYHLLHGVLRFVFYPRFLILSFLFIESISLRDSSPTPPAPVTSQKREVSLTPAGNILGNHPRPSTSLTSRVASPTSPAAETTAVVDGSPHPRVSFQRVASKEKGTQPYTSSRRLTTLIPINIREVLPSTKTGNATSSERHRPTLCGQLPVRGPCFGHLRRWYFDVLDQSCKRFVYGGCAGNKNNFKSRDSCSRMCEETSRNHHHKGTVCGWWVCVWNSMLWNVKIFKFEQF